MKATLSVIVFAAAFAAVNGLEAAPILWSTNSGGNGHYYELIDTGSHIGWTDARVAAEGATHLGSPGHLVTITSQAESDFLRANFASQIGDPVGGVPGIYAWIGLTDQQSEGNFMWVTGEPLTFTDWAPPEPNNLGNEDFVHLWRRDYGGGPLWSWNDANNSPGFPGYTGYFVEFDGPFLEEPAPTQPVPEPSSLCLWAIGAMALAYSAGCRRTQLPG